MPPTSEMPPTWTPVAFVVPGAPAVKGSTVSFLDRRGRLVTKTDSRNGRQWARDVGQAARAAGVPLIPKGAGVIVSVVYEFQPPRRQVRRDPCVRPDCDKLARALLDALTGIAYEDDGQVVALAVRKAYASDTLMRVWIDRA